MKQHDNRVEIEGYSVSTAHFIGGKRYTNDKTFEVRSPLDWTMKLADVSRGDQQTAELALNAATEGFKPWSDMSAAQRAEIMHNLADKIDANIDMIAHIECLDMAMLLESLKLRVIPRAAKNFRAYADLAKEHEERAWSSNGTNNRIIRAPAGPAVIITPWNAPFMLSTWKCAPALAAGNSVILKPAEWSPLSLSLLADWINEAGFPPGAFNIVQGIGSEIGPHLTNDKRVKRISFTGSPETAKSIGRNAAENIIPFTAELGGKGALVVFEDADVKAAAQKASNQFHDSGQVCLAGTRLLVHQDIYQDFVKHFNAFTEKQVSGDSRDKQTTLSPAIHPTHLDRVSQFVERAKSNGDDIFFGGKAVKEGSLWYEPTLIKPKSNSSEVVQNEIFGPVLTIQTFATEDEAIDLANSTEYGLSSIIYTSSAQRAERVGRKIRAGTIWVNTFLIRDLTAPFGGVGISGIGREGGQYALEFHADLKTLQILDGTVS